MAAAKSRWSMRRVLVAVALVVVTCAILSSVYFSLGMDGLKYAIAIVIVCYLGFMLVSWIVYGIKRRGERSDSAATCKPILDEYHETHDVKAVLASYEAWKEGEHGSELRFSFPQSIVSLLVEDGRGKEARRLIDEVETLAPDARTREAVGEWRGRCERRLVEVAREKRGKKVSERSSQSSSGEKASGE